MSRTVRKDCERTECLRKSPKTKDVKLRIMISGLPRGNGNRLFGSVYLLKKETRSRKHSRTRLAALCINMSGSWSVSNLFGKIEIYAFVSGTNANEGRGEAYVCRSGSKETPRYAPRRQEAEITSFLSRMFTSSHFMLQCQSEIDWLPVFFATAQVIIGPRRRLDGECGSWTISELLYVAFVVLRLSHFGRLEVLFIVFR